MRINFNFMLRSRSAPLRKICKIYGLPGGSRFLPPLRPHAGLRARRRLPPFPPLPVPPLPPNRQQRRPPGVSGRHRRAPGVFWQQETTNVIHARRRCNALRARSAARDRRAGHLPQTIDQRGNQPAWQSIRSRMAEVLIPRAPFQPMRNPIAALRPTAKDRGGGTAACPLRQATDWKRVS